MGLERARSWIISTYDTCVYNTCIYMIIFHLFELYTYPNKIFVAFDQCGSGNQGFTVTGLVTSCSMVVTNIMYTSTNTTYMYDVCITQHVQSSTQLQ